MSQLFLVYSYIIQRTVLWDHLRDQWGISGTLLSPRKKYGPVWSQLPIPVPISYSGQNRKISQSQSQLIKSGPAEAWSKACWSERSVCEQWSNLGIGPSLLHILLHPEPFYCSINSDIEKCWLHLSYLTCIYRLTNFQHEFGWLRYFLGGNKNQYFLSW